MPKFVKIGPMRLNKQQIEHLAFQVVKGLLHDKLIMVENREKTVIDVQNVITRELEKEDALDEKVKDILKDKLNEIRNSNIDYYEMFRMVKSKLAEQEDIVL
jgi:Uncharacterized protein conserved in bacteria